ncbi:RNA recognition motif protein [Rhizoctonia solani]|uniref:RNA recognition motif protein n=1 Tax=Rhizoctonia solani TaxID=456999 RepID=A0A8H8NQ80_9AGAM|nr:RNA recognition motif protein [Rhizoctonia solani]QRW16777.1 RNA recognition motif protein [Rhizoctonia solani]
MQTTRLHISGLTPSISASDLKQRFTTFGEVKDVDGVGKLDGVGRPRKFAYLTLETTQPKLARCMNLLSGSTWKGAKLRIGEAKPDYKSRHELEVNPPPPAPRPKLSEEARRRARLKFRLRARRLLRGTQGKQLRDMSLVTLTTVSKHKGWRRTPLNHLVRPMRMRPLRPLPSLRPRQSSSKTKLKEKLNKRKFKLTRARLTVIDPAREDEEEKKVPEVTVRQELPVEQESEESTRSPTPVPAPSCIGPVTGGIQTTRPRASEAEDLLSLTREKSSALALLGGMFGEGEWEGRESVSGDEMEVVDGEENEEVGYDVVPRAVDHAIENTETRHDDEDEEEGEEPQESDEEMEQEELIDEDEEQGEQEEQEEQESPIKHSSLKDMFKPQEETTGFSLGLDIELDPDAESFLPSSVSAPPPPEPVLALAPIQVEKHAHTIQFTPDPKASFFFPGGKNDILRVIVEKGWEWPHPGTSEQIRAKWDKNKAELTREYTKRHREAVKRRRRAGGTKGDDS